MMKALTAILSLVAISQAAILCPDNACETIKCDTKLTAESCSANGGNLQAKGGFCGCCDLCVQTLNEGDDCTVTLLIGAPPTAECDTQADLHCDTESNLCSKKSCAMKKDQLEKWAAALPVRPMGLSIPVCAADGSYAGKQCSGSQCYCVDPEGKAIPGYSHNRWETDEKVTCQCARDFAAYRKKGIIGRLFHCSDKGDYESVQCHGSTCYCADRSTGKQLLGSGVHIVDKDTLNC